jgi:hypothetical protein
LLCVDSGYPGNLIHRIFNEFEAIDSLENIELSEDNKNIIVGHFSNIYEKNKTAFVEEVETLDQIEITDAQVVRVAFELIVR